MEMEGDDFGSPELRQLAATLRRYRAISVAQLLEAQRASGESSRDLSGSETGAGPGEDRRREEDGEAAGTESSKPGEPTAGRQDGRDSRGPAPRVIKAVQSAGSARSTAEDDPMSSVGLPSTSETVKEFERQRGRTKNAAVLIPLFKTPEGELRVWLTKRASKLSSHSGEVALPGGKRDEGDADDAATALREAEEEIGLAPSRVRVVATLEPFLSKHLLTVTPVVGLLPEGSAFEPRANAGEVDVVFSAPLEMFLEDDTHTAEDLEWLGMPYRVHFFNYTVDGLQFKVWGLTAAILVRTASVVFNRAPGFGEFHPTAPSYAAVLSDLAKRRLLNI